MAPESDSETASINDKAEIAYQHARNWQEVFDNLTDNSQADALRAQAIAELDALYPYRGNHVYISGYGLQLVQDPETGRPVGEVWDYAQGCEGQHLGFSVLETDDDQDGPHYHVVHQVLTGGKKGMIENTIYQELLYFNFFNLDSTCLIVDDLNGIFYGENSEPVGIDKQISVVLQSSQALASLLRSTAFRRMNHAKQKQRVDALVTQTERDANIRGTELLAEAEYGYINVFNNKNTHLVPVDVRDAVIGGMCLGLETLESLVLRRRAIRSDANLVNKSAGICLVLDPNPDTRQGLHLSDEQLFYMPIGQHLRLEKIT